MSKLKAVELFNNLTYGFEVGRKHRLLEALDEIHQKLKFKARHELLAILLRDNQIQISATQLLVLAGGGSKGSAVQVLRARTSVPDKKVAVQAAPQTAPNALLESPKALDRIRRELNYLGSEVKLLKAQLDSTRQINIALQALVAEAIYSNNPLAAERREKIAQVLNSLELIRNTPTTWENVAKGKDE